MNVNKSHKKSPPKRPRRARAARPSSVPIERVSTEKLIESIKRDIQAQVEKAKPDEPEEK